MKSIMYKVFFGMVCLLVLLLIIVFLMMLMNKKISFIKDDKSYMIVCFIIGFMMCCFGITRNLSELNWLDPLTIISAIIGTIITLIFILMIIKGKCGLINSYKSATIIIFILIISKWVIQIIQDFVIKKI